jgi:hypothetical protein
VTTSSPRDLAPLCFWSSITPLDTIRLSRDCQHWTTRNMLKSPRHHEILRICSCYATGRLANMQSRGFVVSTPRTVTSTGLVTTSNTATERR